VAIYFFKVPFPFIVFGAGIVGLIGGLVPDAAQGVRTVDWFAAILNVGAFVGMVKWKWDVIPEVLGAAVFGVIYRAILGS